MVCDQAYGPATFGVIPSNAVGARSR
jgi:hypothetical protein